MNGLATISTTGFLLALLVQAGFAPAAFATSETEIYVARQLPNETAAHYRAFPCDYLEVAAKTADEFLAGTLPEAKQLGSARKVAVGLVRMEKSCPTTTLLSGGRLGLSIDDIDPGKSARLNTPTSGVWVNSAAPGSTGERAGVLARDVIVALNDVPVEGVITLRTLVGRTPVGTQVKLKIWRAPQWLELYAEVGPPLPGTAVASVPISAPATASAPRPSAISPATSLQGMTLEMVSGPVATAVGLPQAAGLRVVGLDKGSLGEKAGFKALDVILDVAGQEVGSVAQLSAIVERMRPGYKATLTVWRYRAKKELSLVLK
ncbi:MAG: PDZ domain-containing protein [Pseudomonas sp.]|uniref:PDZ domain-containing protein n=1 Tax=Pseudomonas sp. TaxID=306 RepID=UPI0030F23D67